MMVTSDTSNNPIVERILDSFTLTPDQRRAAAARGMNIVVTAGAGSGKTRTLVARYISLLAEGLAPRRVSAITFTEKAAREMRSRVRASLQDQISQAESAEESQHWHELDAQMDSARIGTIHSLCAEILRSHPAEASVDPRFEVLDEGLAATLRAQAVDDTLAALVGDPAFAPLLGGLKTSAVEKLLAYLLDHRLEAQAAFDNPKDIQGTIRQALENCIMNQTLLQPVGGLQRLAASGSLAVDAGDKLAEQIMELLSLWNQVTQALLDGDWIGATRDLFTARRQTMGGSTGKKNSQAKAMLADLKDAYDQQLNPWLGGKGAQDPPPDEPVENLFVQTMPLMRQAFERLLQIYQSALRQRQALDFDDLEAGAARLLAMPAISRQWQDEIDALLVDEFQDTNSRQRKIVDALCGDTPGRLFVVGDARQSIYRFRRADVTVFRNLQEEIQRRGGLVIELNLTYRAHTSLLQATGDLLAATMGDQPIPEQPYYVPFSPLYADHDLPRPGMQAPHVEFILGGGEDAESARPAAAQALAQRLHELRQVGQILRWDDVTILFRASSGFPTYENAFEDAGIPFVTVAGQGFYNRPEIRDVLNLLRALADPWDDLAMVGLLRSPAFGLSDAALYHLRWHSGQKQPYWAALQGDLNFLAEPDQTHARRALEVLGELQPLVDRLPVAELLKRLVDSVDYRAILATVEAAAGRLWRNLDKLLADAQASGLVNVRAFLEYLDTLRDVGAREGEAPAEAEGAVRLMTIHKAKGLEFPLVILADAARQPRKASQMAYLLDETGLAFKFDQLEAAPLLYRLAQFHDSQQAEAEEKRLLYVALTRAKEKLLISGHSTQNRSGVWKADGWLGALTAAGGVNLGVALNDGQPVEAATAGGHPLRVWALPLENSATILVEPPVVEGWPESAEPPLYRSLLQPAPDDGMPETTDSETAETPRPWRATGERLRLPAEALGRLVHYAIQHWLFPAISEHQGQTEWLRLLETATFEAGLAEPAQRMEAMRLAEILLVRLQQHPLWQEIDQAQERYHEVPYARFAAKNRLDTGYIDLLYRHQGEWQIVDFKTDNLHSATERQAAIEKYRPQMRRYAQAALDLLREPARVRLCFLDDEGKISLQEM
jgi:ATP-dependent helicase/nuclease subunit A